MIAVNEAFSATYAQARVRFLEAAARAGLAIESHVHPLAGREGETLAMDVARDGPADAASVLIVSSACHGVEGHCGSGVQVFALHDQEWLAKARGAGVAVLYIHALNPYGFSHGRRVTHENVDLNRNFQDFSQPLPVNESLPRGAPAAAARGVAAGRSQSGRHTGVHPRARRDRLAGRHHPRAARVCRRPVLRRRCSNLEQPDRAPGAAPACRPGATRGLDRPAHGPGAQRPRRAHLCMPR
jgi:hypothetical protein